MKKLLPFICCICLLFAACRGSQDKENSSKEKYENNKLSLEELEKNHPRSSYPLAVPTKKI